MTWEKYILVSSESSTARIRSSSLFIFVDNCTSVLPVPFCTFVVNMNFEPLLGLDSIHISPCMSSTICLEITRPSPVPPKFIFTTKVQKGTGKTEVQLSTKINRDELRILAVDDSEETRMYFSHVMEAFHLPCDVAHSGEKALEMMEAADKPYNLFFVDWQMPDMDGVELTKKIKEITGDKSFVIMLSMADWKTIEKEALAAGVRHFIPKPIFPSVLINIINECIEIKPKDGSGKQDGSAETDYNFKDYSILVAEDVEINREILSTVLEETGISIDFAQNGSSAVSMFQMHPDKYDLVLMDVNMPEMDGYEATQAIRALEIAQGKDICIIAMTANVFREDVEKCLAAGMNDHIGKPIAPEALHEKLKKYLVKKGIIG